MTALLFIFIFISCSSEKASPSSYIDLMKNQKLSVISLDKTIGEVFDVVSKGKVVWKAGPMPANDTEYRYRNIHKTSVLVEAFWPVNLGELFGNKEVELKFQFAVKKDKSEFELYRTAINGEYENSEGTKTTAQSIGAEYINTLKSIAVDKQKNEAAKWAAETAPYIKMIKSIHSDIYNDTLENVYNTIAGSVRGEGEVEWSCQKLESGKENIRLYLVLASCPVDEHLWHGWGSSAKPKVIFGHIAGDDLLKMENNKWKQGDMYAIFRKCELTNFEKIDLSKEEDVNIFEELQDYLYKTYEEKTGKDIQPSRLEIKRIEVAPYIDSVKNTHSNTYNDTYDNFYTESNGSYISEATWTAYKLEGNNPQIDKDLLPTINAPENIGKKFYIVEMSKKNRSKEICVLFYAGNDWSTATNNKVNNGDIYKVKIDNIDLDMKKPEDAKKWLDIFNEWVGCYWMNSHKYLDQNVPQAKNLDEAK